MVVSGQKAVSSPQESLENSDVLHLRYGHIL